MTKALITGASGMVGYAVCREAIDQGLNVFGLGRENRHFLPGMSFIHGDLTNTDALKSILENIAPDLVIHLAANTDHKACEHSPEATRQLHVDASEYLAETTGLLGGRFVHISTEAVYGNLGPGKRRETEECFPQGVYATTKKEAEQRVLQANPDALVLRVTPVGFAPNGAKKTLAEWLFQQFSQDKRVTGYDDVFFTPVSSYSLARLVLNQKLIGHHGIYNWGNMEILSKYDFACSLASSLGFKDAKIDSGRHSLNGDPLHGGLDSTALSKALGIPEPSKEDLLTDLTRHAPK